MNQELLYKYFKGITSIEEEKMILDWVDASDENRDTFLKERMIYDISLFSDKQDNNEKKTVRIMPMLRWTARIAAVTIVAIAGYFITSDFLYNTPSAQWRNQRLSECGLHRTYEKRCRVYQLCQRSDCG